LIVKVAVTFTEPWLAVIVAEVTAATPVVVIVKAAVVAPAGTVTVAGTVALPTFEARFTVAPPVGAAAPRVTVPVEDEPPVTVVGDIVTLVRDGAVTVSEAVAETTPRFAESALAVIVAVSVVETEVVETENVADVAPESTVTVAGTVANEESDES
jgi:hypothetical protein